MFRELFFCAIVVMFHYYWCTSKPCSTSIMLYNNNNNNITIIYSQWHYCLSIYYIYNTHRYSEYISQLRAKFPAMKFAIIHVTAEEETVLARAEKRAQETGRHVPKEVLLETMEQIPVSLKVLSPSVRLYVGVMLYVLRAIALYCC